MADGELPCQSRRQPMPAVMEPSHAYNANYQILQTPDSVVIHGARGAGTGVSTPARVGDVFFVPANLTHGYSTVNGVVAWLDIRWDVDWEKK